MKRQRHSSRGAALLAAMLMVSLVAMLAAGAAWQQWRTVEVESTERQHAQAQWLLLGALDWARVILREDARSGNPDTPTDHLAEPWAIPLQEARLSTFLSANSSNSGGSQATTNSSATFSNSPSDDALAQQVYLSGQISDLQACPTAKRRCPPHAATRLAAQLVRALSSNFGRSSPIRHSVAHAHPDQPQHRPAGRALRKRRRLEHVRRATP